MAQRGFRPAVMDVPSYDKSGLIRILGLVVNHKPMRYEPTVQVLDEVYLAFTQGSQPARLKDNRQRGRKREAIVVDLHPFKSG